MPLLFAADHLLCSPHTTTLVKTSHEALPTVQETNDGWLIKASLPGLGAGDVSVEITKAKDGNDTTENHLLLHALPRFKTELRCVQACACARACACDVQRGLQRPARRGADLVPIRVPFFLR